ncbi:hypothetical protein, partial [Shewanella sp.]|uniref:hypothetical protein n=1 Tax=Shewanella sp. TaxID=50422 RepID=UPI004047EF5A
KLIQRSEEGKGLLERRLLSRAEVNYTSKSLPCIKDQQFAAKITLKDQQTLALINIRMYLFGAPDPVQ